MASLAIAGYGLFGPRANAAAGPSRRPADVATNVPTTPSPTALKPSDARQAPAMATAPGFSVGASKAGGSDLAAMQAEVNDIEHQITSLQAQMVRQGMAPAGNRAGSQASTSVSDWDRMSAMLNDMMAKLHTMILSSYSATVPSQGNGTGGS